jgi:uncharacterized repeat protein (TIGR01451 family)
LELDVGGTTALTLTLADRVDPVSPGSNLTYAIVVSNQGAEVQQGLRLGVQLPAGVRLVGSEGASHGAQAGSWIRFDEVPALEPGVELRWRLFARVPSVEELTASGTTQLEILAQVETRDLGRALEARETTDVRVR